jgi:dephospho-CoA kinase
LVIKAPEHLRHDRLWKRSQLNLDEISERTRHHIPEAEKERRATAVIHNHGDLEDLKKEIQSALKKIGV